MVAAFMLYTGAALEAQRPTFRSGIEMVPLTVTVTDGAGRHTTGLSAADFAVFEDGALQTLSFFASEAVAVDVAFLIDSSSSMGPSLPLVKTAVGGLIDELRDGDRAAIVEVKDTVLMPQRLTADLTAIRAAVDAVSASGSTALYEGVYTALREFERSRRGDAGVRRQVLIVLSDGYDTTSHVDFDGANDLARQVGVSIYTIALHTLPLLPAGAAAVPRSRAELNAAYAMRALATDAGGRAFSPTSAGELPAIYRAIGRELACQYQLGYVPSKPGTGEFRRLSVRVLPPTRANARTRSGYVAVRRAPARGERTAPDVRD
jgi:VWFA-related protein